MGEELGTKREADLWVSRSLMSVYDYKIQEATTNLKMNRSGAADTRPAERPSLSEFSYRSFSPRRKKAAIFSIVLRAPVRRDVLCRVKYSCQYKLFVLCSTPMKATVPANKISPADPRLEADTRALYDALSELIRVYQFRDRDRICCHDVSVTQCYALEVLVRERALTLNDLAAHLYLDKSTASRVVDALERKAYVIRSPHPGDGRALQLKITPAGRALYGRIVSDILAEERALLAGFGPDVRRAMTELISQLARAAERRMERAGETCCQPV